MIPKQNAKYAVIIACSFLVVFFGGYWLGYEDGVEAGKYRQGETALKCEHDRKEDLEDFKEQIKVSAALCRNVVFENNKNWVKAVIANCQPKKSGMFEVPIVPSLPEN